MTAKALAFPTLSGIVIFTRNFGKIAMIRQDEFGGVL
jgi:hypothetical protein